MNHPLAGKLAASNEAADLHAIAFEANALPEHDLRPSFALPIHVRSKLEAIVFYGPHANHEELDPDEIDSLDRFLTDAAAAFDHVHAEIATQKLRELEREVAALRAQLAEAAGKAG